MALHMKSLVGMTCIEEAMPPGSDIDFVDMLVAVEVLAQAMELTPAPELTEDQVYDNKPDFQPTPAPGSSPAPRM